LIGKIATGPNLLGNNFNLFPGIVSFVPTSASRNTSLYSVPATNLQQMPNGAMRAIAADDKGSFDVDGFSLVVHRDVHEIVLSCCCAESNVVSYSTSPPLRRNSSRSNFSVTSWGTMATNE